MINILILSCLRIEAHPSHLNLEEALELINITLSRTADELSLEGEDIGIKKQAYYRTGMINMKWGEYDKAIEGYLNAEKLVLEYPDEDHAAWWSPHYKMRIGQTYMLMGNYKKSAEYYLKSYDLFLKCIFCLNTVIH